ncbi:MAG: hypothetical protein KKF68_00865 [Nanoarchaeota archaeon]|nr:hypothetical protein [Nanoarchaeota archaeon]
MTLEKEVKDKKPPKKRVEEINIYSPTFRREGMLPERDYTLFRRKPGSFYSR